MSRINKNDFCKVTDNENGLTLVHLTNCVEYLPLSGIATMFGVSKSAVEKKIRDLSKNHSIRILFWSDGLRLIHIQDFRSALFNDSNLKI